MFYKNSKMVILVAHAFDPSTQEVEEDGSLSSGPVGLRSEILLIE